MRNHDYYKLCDGRKNREHFHSFRFDGFSFDSQPNARKAELSSEFIDNYLRNLAKGVLNGENHYLRYDSGIETHIRNLVVFGETEKANAYLGKYESLLNIVGAAEKSPLLRRLKKEADSLASK